MINRLVGTFNRWHKAGLIDKVLFYTALIVAIAVLAINNIPGAKGLTKIPDSLVSDINIFCLLIVLFSFFRLIDKLPARIESRHQRFDNIEEAFLKIREYLYKRKARYKNRVIQVDILASTGASTIGLLKNDIRELNNAKFRVALLNPQKSPARLISSSWPDEINAAVKTLDAYKNRQDLKQRNVTFDYNFYESLPCLHGFLVDGRYLYLGYYRWVNTSDPNATKLAGAEMPYTFYDGWNEPDASYVELFKEWFKYAWEGIPGEKDEGDKV